jgi:hypothetical protein
MAATVSKASAVPPRRPACRGGGGSVPEVRGGGLSARPRCSLPRPMDLPLCPLAESLRQSGETSWKPPRVFGETAKGLAASPRPLGNCRESSARRRKVSETAESPRRDAKRFRRAGEGSRKTARAFGVAPRVLGEPPQGLGKTPKGFGAASVVGLKCAAKGSAVLLGAPASSRPWAARMAALPAKRNTPRSGSSRNRTSDPPH